ncbi:MAG: amidohydrolase family protein, partial [Myxococcales bacterium]
VRLIDGLGSAPVEGASLVIEGAVVRAAGPSDQVPVPAGATVIEMAGKTVLPGLVNNHAHVGQVEDGRSGPEFDTRTNALQALGQFEAYGVTTVTSLGLNGSVFYELQPGLHAGTLAGADLFGADRGLGVPAAAPPVKADAEHLDRPATAEQAREMVRAAAARHPSLLKIWVDDFHGSLPVKMSPEIYRAVLDEAHRLGLRVAAHVYYLDDARALVDAGVDVLAHGVRDRPVDDAFIAALKAHRTWYIATLALDEASFVYAERPAWTLSPFLRQAIGPQVTAQLDDPDWRARVLGDAKKLAEDRASLAMGLANLRRLHDAGVAIGFGTDAGAQPLRIPGVAEHRELALMVQAGLTPLQAITVATRRAAELLGLDDRGTLAPGKLADFIVTDGRPDVRIDDLAQLTAVWHRGKPVRGPIAAFRR